VERVPAGDGVLYVVVRKEEPAREGGGARLAFVHRQDALLAAAALAALATANDVTLNTEKRSGRRSRFGYPIDAGGRHLGHITRPEEAFPAAFHTVRRLAADPASVALFVETLDPETLAILGRAIMRRLSGRPGPVARRAGAEGHRPARRGLRRLLLTATGAATPGVAPLRDLRGETAFRALSGSTRTFLPTPTRPVPAGRESVHRCRRAGRARPGGGRSARRSGGRRRASG